MAQRSSFIWSIALAVSLAGLHCDSRKAGTTATDSGASTQPTVSGSSAGAALSAAPTASVAAPRDAGPDEWYQCKKNQDCELVNQGRCCEPCNPSNFEGHYSAINSKFKAEYAA